MKKTKGFGQPTQRFCNTRIPTEREFVVVGILGEGFYVLQDLTLTECNYALVHSKSKLKQFGFYIGAILSLHKAPPPLRLVASIFFEKPPKQYGTFHVAL